MIEANPAADLPTIRVPVRLPRPTPELVVADLMACEDRRLRLMGMLAAYCGLRAGEIAKVHSDERWTSWRSHGCSDTVESRPLSGTS
jgi:integrase